MKWLRLTKADTDDPVRPGPGQVAFMVDQDSGRLVRHDDDGKLTNIGDWDMTNFVKTLIPTTYKGLPLNFDGFFSIRSAVGMSGAIVLATYSDGAYWEGQGHSHGVLWYCGPSGEAPLMIADDFHLALDSDDIANRTMSIGNDNNAGGVIAYADSGGQISVRDLAGNLLGRTQNQALGQIGDPCQDGDTFFLGSNDGGTTYTWMSYDSTTPSTAEQPAGALSTYAPGTGWAGKGRAPILTQTGVMFVEPGLTSPTGLALWLNPGRVDPTRFDSDDHPLVDRDDYCSSFGSVGDWPAGIAYLEGFMLNGAGDPDGLCVSAVLADGTGDYFQYLMSRQIYSTVSFSNGPQYHTLITDLNSSDVYVAFCSKIYHLLPGPIGAQELVHDFTGKVEIMAMSFARKHYTDGSPNAIAALVWDGVELSIKWVDSPWDQTLGGS